MAEHIVSACLFGMGMSMENIVASSSRCMMMNAETNRRSIWTVWFICVLSLAVAIDLLPGLCHCLQMEHESQTDATNLRADSGTPAAARIVCIREAGACHHRRWSCLTARVTRPTEPDRSSLRLRPKSKLDQSGRSGAAPYCASGMAARSPGSTSSSSTSCAGMFAAAEARAFAEEAGEASAGTGNGASEGA